MKPQPRPSWLARETWAALPEALVRREVRDHRGRPGFRTRQITLVTTLLDADSSRVADRAELYRPRGQVETAPAHLKTTRPMDVWPGQTVPGVLKELTLLAIVDNLVRRVMGPAAGLQQLEVERSSGRDALRWLSAPSTEIPLGALLVNPTRPHRVEPRVKQRRPKPFPLMIKPRHIRRQQLVPQELGG